jgi:hypothetical protein
MSRTCGSGGWGRKKILDEREIFRYKFREVLAGDRKKRPEVPDSRRGF